MLFPELYKIMVNKVTFVGFRRGDRHPRDPPLAELILQVVKTTYNCRYKPVVHKLLARPKSDFNEHLTTQA